MPLSREIKKLMHQLRASISVDSFANPGSKSKISANIICKNNLSSLSYSLASLVNCIDEIVVIDTGSEDGSLEFLLNYLPKNFPNYKLFQEKTFQGYSYHRNQAIKESSGDWILVLDSDEFLSKSLQENLRQLSYSKYYSAYRFYRRWICNLTNADYIFTRQFRGRYKSIVRMFRNINNICYQGELHESVLGLENLRIKKIPEQFASIYHLDTAINPYAKRLAKVQAREAKIKGAGHPEEYLPEDFNLPCIKVPPEDLDLLRIYSRINVADNQG